MSIELWQTIEIPTANLEFFFARGAYKSASYDNDPQPATEVQLFRR